jgi:hypothetical protein
MLRSRQVEEVQIFWSKAWGFVAKEVGIKPGSKAFKDLRDRSAGSAEKGKRKKGK